jgi:uncharacterized paraquat-inducible protein A
MNEQIQKRTGGIEGKLDSIGNFNLFFSVIALVICIFYSQDVKVNNAGLSLYWIVVGIIVLGQGILFWVIFHAAAEVIRLLKKLNRIPYGGYISETQIQLIDKQASTEEKSYYCSECEAPVAANDKVCPKCGVKL